MPPKVKFTKEEIVAAAVNVARRRGLASVTTRDIAAELGVSTRPIFTYFKSMDEVRAEIRAAAAACFGTYMDEGLRAPVPFYGVGMQYLRFARQEPELYKILFLSKEAGGAMAAMRQLQDAVRPALCEIYHMTADEADRYARDMWLVSHSVAALIVTGNCPYTDEQIGKIFTGFSAAVCKAIKEIPGFTDGSFDRDAVFRGIIGQNA